VLDQSFVQAALVAKLQTITDFQVVLELEYQGTDIPYPSARVRISQTPPRGEQGSCHESHSNLTMLVAIFSEKDSSLEAMQLGTQVVNLLFGKHLIGSNFRTLSIDMRGTNGPYQAKPREWRHDLYFTAHGYQTL